MQAALEHQMWTPEAAQGAMEAARATAEGAAALETEEVAAAWRAATEEWEKASHIVRSSPLLGPAPPPLDALEAKEYPDRALLTRPLSKKSVDTICIQAAGVIGLVAASGAAVSMLSFQCGWAGRQMPLLAIY
eukprot:gnl/MRDRNA2_/MRDRNA2_21351_c0_seq1.p1 gnl/MRDRNA2_/MRDRNA2_21351_c0~~gnl/MRDRNA2_/MRDRNA2_21351_c0_seq1.p1  ORF type:complete len:141 (-),score=35.44 gnl/MRDRNA2_/MRDRNA2_21351_c0_seq1:118-516(-)